MPNKAKLISDWCLAQGDRIGKLVSFFGLPAVLIGAFAYSSEIIDSFTEPTVSADIDRVSVRCAYVFRSSQDVRKYNDGDDSVLTKVCDEANTSASFAVTFANQDSILRTIVDLHAEITMPFGGTLELRLARQQLHQVVGIAETQVRSDWMPLEIRPQRERMREAWIEPSTPDASMKWRLFRELLNSGAYSTKTQVFGFQLFAEFERWREPVLVESCRLTMEPDQVKRFNSQPDFRQIQITISCDPLPSTTRPHRSR